MVADKSVIVVKMDVRNGHRNDPPVLCSVFYQTLRNQIQEEVARNNATVSILIIPLLSLEVL